MTTQNNQPRSPFVQNLEVKIRMLNDCKMDIHTYEDLVNYRERLYLMIDMQKMEGGMSSLEAAHYKYKVAQACSAMAIHILRLDEA